jgi:hypothetical protein
VGPGPTPSSISNRFPACNVGRCFHIAQSPLRGLQFQPVGRVDQHESTRGRHPLGHLTGVPMSEPVTREAASIPRSRAARPPLGWSLVITTSSLCDSTLPESPISTCPFFPICIRATRIDSFAIFYSTGCYAQIMRHSATHWPVRLHRSRSWSVRETTGVGSPSVELWGEPTKDDSQRRAWRELR